MAISGRKSKMTKGRLDGAVVQFTESQWTEDETKGGKDVVNFTTNFVDADETGHKRRFYLGDRKFVHVDGDGAIRSVDQSRDYSISADMAAGKLFDSIEAAAEAEGCPKAAKKQALSALDDIGDTPGGLDGLWVRLKSEASSGSLKQDGTPFTDLLVDELLSGPEGGGVKDSKTEKAKKKQTSAPPPDDDSSGDDDADGSSDDDDDSDDPVHAAAVEAMDKILTSLSTKTPLVKNFDKDAAGGGITVKQAYTASFGVLKGKDVKGPGSNLINDPAFHAANAVEGLYQFNKKTGVIKPAD